MNGFLALSSFVCLGLIILIAGRLGKTYLFVLSAFIIVATNVTIGIQVDIFGLSLSWAVIMYSMVYLITDILSEFHEKNDAYKLAATNLAIQMIFWLYIYFTLAILPSAGEQAYTNVASLFSTTPRITLAAIVASLGAFADIWVYERIREWSRTRDGVLKQLWVRNNVSTIIGQSLNTALFFLIALYGVLPNIWEIIGAALLVKWTIAFLDTPLLYGARYVYNRMRPVTA